MKELSWFEVLKISISPRVGSHLDYDELIDIYFDTIENIMEKSGNIDNALWQWNDEKEVYQLTRNELSRYRDGQGVPLFGNYYVRVSDYEESEDENEYGQELYDVEEAEVYYDDYSGQHRVASYTGNDGYYFDGARDDARTEDRQTIERAMARLLDSEWEDLVPEDKLDDLNEEKWKDKQ
mgnify:CR=1 FL=1